MSQDEKGFSLQLFAGFLVNSELRMYMRASDKWKEHQISPLEGIGELKLVHFQEQDYIGVYLDPPLVKLAEIQPLEEKIRSRIYALFPKYKQEGRTLQFFCQTFIN